MASPRQREELFFAPSPPVAEAVPPPSFPTRRNTWSASRLKAPLPPSLRPASSSVRRQSGDAAVDSQQLRLMKRATEFQDMSRLALDVLGEGVTAWMAQQEQPSLGDVGSLSQFQRAVAEQHALDATFAKDAALGPTGLFMSALRISFSSAEPSLNAALSTLPILVFLDALASVEQLPLQPNVAAQNPSHTRETKWQFFAALRAKMVSTVSIMADVEAFVGFPLDVSGCASISKLMRTPLSPGEIYTPMPPMSVEHCEVFRGLWDRLERRKQAVEMAWRTFEAASAQRTKRAPTMSGKVPMPAAGQTSAYATFRRRPSANVRGTPAPIASGDEDTIAAELQHQQWVFGAAGLASGFERHDALWAGFEPVLLGRSDVAPHVLASALNQPSTVASLGLIPWPESILMGIRACATSATAAEKIQCRRFVKSCQRRWHPDRFQAFAARSFASAPADAERLLTRVTKIAQLVNSLKDVIL